MKNDFGYTNDPTELANVVSFREAAIADGWTLEKVYDHEPADSYGKLSRNGFLMHVNARDAERQHEWGAHKKGERYKYRYQAEITIWGPDGLVVKAPSPYSWEEISSGTTICSKCKSRNVPTQRVGFAGRVCAACLPEARASIETPGWCD